MARDIEGLREKARKAITNVVGAYEDWAREERVDEVYQNHLYRLADFYYGLAALTDNPLEQGTLDGLKELERRLKQYLADREA